MFWISRKYEMLIFAKKKFITAVICVCSLFVLLIFNTDRFYVVKLCFHCCQVGNVQLPRQEVQSKQIHSNAMSV